MITDLCFFNVFCLLLLLKLAGLLHLFGELKTIPTCIPGPSSRYFSPGTPQHCLRQSPTQCVLTP